MESLFVGFILIVFVSGTIDFAYHYQFYKRSLLKQLYHNYIEYYWNLKRKTGLESTRFLESKLGFHKIVYVKSPNPTLNYYVLLLTTNGIHMIIPNPSNKSKANYPSCLKEVERIYTEDFRKGKNKLYVYYLTSSESKQNKEKRLFCIPKEKLVQQMTQNVEEAYLTKNDIKWMYGNFVIEEG